MATALLIVDVQNDFIEGGSLAVPGGQEVAKKVEKLIKGDHGYDLVVGSKDHHHDHGTNSGHFAPEGEDPDYVNTWPAHCVQGTHGNELAYNGDYLNAVIEKGQGVPAYSAFEGHWSGQPQSLDQLLGLYHITDIDVCGIATDYCVRATVLDAIEHGFNVRLLTDLIVGVAPETSEKALAEMHEAGALSA